MTGFQRVQRSEVRSRLSGASRSNSAKVAAAGVAIAIATAFPFAQKGWLLLLDWIPGPQSSQLSRNAWGLDGGVTASLPFSALMAASGGLLGEATVGWLAIALLFPIGMLSMSRLIQGPLVAVIAAGLAYVICPVMYQRLWVGHIGFLFGYALLPAAAASIINCTKAEGLRRLAPALWITLLAAFSVHFLWITAPLLVGTLVVHSSRVRNAITVFAVCAGLLITSVYLIPGSSESPAPFSVSNSDLSAYATVPQGVLGLYPAVASLYGFWRDEPDLPIDHAMPWLLFASVFALIAIAGVVTTLKSTGDRRKLVHLAIAAGAGFFLALGTKGPTGPLFQFLFDHLLGFQVMREPQKFVALLALFYAYAFGLGVQVLWSNAKNTGGKGVAVAALGVPLLLTPSLFNGLSGGARPHSYPESWYQADRLMGDGDGSVLFLPWHQYMDLRFADDRRIGTPAGAFFQRHVVLGDNVELPNLESASNSPRSGYLQYLYGLGYQFSVMGRAVAPLGIQYIAVDHSADWRQYGWLDQQQDLRKVVDAPDFQLYENLAYTGPASAVKEVRTVDNWTEMLRIISTTGETADGFVVRERRGETVPSSLPSPPPLAKQTPTVAFDRSSPVSASISDVSNASAINFGESFDAAWKMQGESGTTSAVGSILFDVPSEASKISLSYANWEPQRNRYLVSGAGVVALLLLTNLTPARIAGIRRRLSK
jgi:hypothetical protein